MKKNAIEVHPQYIINKLGKKTGVILDINTFEKIMERLEESYLGKQAEKVLSEETEYVDFSKVRSSRNFSNPTLNHHNLF